VVCGCWVWGWVGGDVGVLCVGVLACGVWCVVGCSHHAEGLVNPKVCALKKGY
jgi:hypothetical protein